MPLTSDHGFDGQRERFRTFFGDGKDNLLSFAASVVTNLRVLAAFVELGFPKRRAPAVPRLGHRRPCLRLRYRTVTRRTNLLCAAEDRRQTAE